MSEKRPESSADIVTRSKAVTGSHGDAPERKRHTYSVDLQRHMAECDANYHRLLRLFPELKQQDIREFKLALPHVESQVLFEVTERGRYTTLLDISFASEDQWTHIATPRLTVRIYHDAANAEVVAYQNQNYFHGKYDYPNTRMRQRDEKVQVNRFLSEFLGLCLEHGANAHPISF